MQTVPSGLTQFLSTTICKIRSATSFFFQTEQMDGRSYLGFNHLLLQVASVRVRLRSCSMLINFFSTTISSTLFFEVAVFSNIMLLTGCVKSNLSDCNTYDTFRFRIVPSTTYLCASNLWTPEIPRMKWMQLDQVVCTSCLRLALVTTAICDKTWTTSSPIQRKSTIQISF